MLIRRSLIRLAFVPFVAAALAAQSPKENGAAIDRWLESQVAEGFRGQVLLERDGEVVLDRAYGRADESKPVAATTSTLYYIGSLAKMFTSAVVLQLEKEGKLALGDTIDRHVDAVPNDKKGITIRQLLTHTSGAIGNHPDIFAKLDRDAFVRWFLATPLAGPAGKHSYSNVGYSLLAAIVERAGGEPFTAAVRRRVFEPAGMKDTFFVDDLGKNAERLAVGIGDSLKKTGADGNAAHYGGTWLRMGPGGIVSTARDLLQWEQALRAGKVLDADQYRAATTPYEDGAPWGLGWRLSRTTRKTPLHFHDGGMPGFNALFGRFPDEHAVIVVLSNRDEVAGKAGRRLAQDLFAK